MLRVVTLTAATLSLAMFGTACNKDAAPTTNPGDAAAGGEDEPLGATDDLFGEDDADGDATDEATDEAAEEDEGGGW